MIVRPIMEYFCVFVLTVIIAAVYFYFQPQILIANGLGWDGVEYSKTFEFFASRSNVTASFPFCNRVGTPFLAHLLGDKDIFSSFKIVNTFFAIVFSCAIYTISRSLGYSYYYSGFSFFLTVGLFFSPLRFIPFYPIYTDPGFLALLSISFLFLVNMKFGLSFIFLFMAYPFKETAIFLAPVFLLFAIYLGGLDKRIVIKFIFALLGMSITRLLILHYMNCNGSQIMTALAWTYRGLSDPQRFVCFFAAISMTAAPMVYIKNMRKLSRVEKVSIFGFFVAAGLSFVGGSDSTRIFYGLFPIYFIAIISIMREKGYLFSFVSALGYIVVNRFSTKIAEPVSYYPVRDESGLFWQFPDHARPEVAILILSVWLILFIIFEKTLNHPDGGVGRKKTNEGCF